MVQRPPRFRLGECLRAATRVFVSAGYARAQMDDVAESLGVAKGTLYRYVESKEALFDACLRFATDPNGFDTEAELPWPTPKPGATVRFVRERVTEGAQRLKLVSIAAAPTCHADARAELHDILTDLYRVMREQGTAIKLVDRCAPDFPDVARAWFGEGRWAQHELLSLHLARLDEQGRLRPGLEVSIAARSALEVLAFWAIHRPWDPSPQEVREADVEHTVIGLVCDGIVAEGAQ